MASTTPSYQVDDEHRDPEVIAKRQAERRERNKDDPFYIGYEAGHTGRSTPIHNILKDSNGVDLDMDSIPIMDLDLGGQDGEASTNRSRNQTQALPPKRRKKVAITGDETIPVALGLAAEQANKEAASTAEGQPSARSKAAKSILQVDSSGLGKFSFTDEGTGDDEAVRDARRREEDEAEMARAMKEVERARLEMQRAADRIQAAKGVPPEGTVVKKKAKKPKRVAVDDNTASALRHEVDDTAVVKKKKKAKKATEEGQKEKKKRKTKGREENHAGGLSAETSAPILPAP
jgi:AP-3 complex subunit delta-1